MAPIAREGRIQNLKIQVASILKPFYVLDSMLNATTNAWTICVSKIEVNVSIFVWAIAFWWLYVWEHVLLLWWSSKCEGHVNSLWKACESPRRQITFLGMFPSRHVNEPFHRHGIPFEGMDFPYIWAWEIFLQRHG